MQPQLRHRLAARELEVADREIQFRGAQGCLSCEGYQCQDHAAQNTSSSGMLSCNLEVA